MPELAGVSATQLEAFAWEVSDGREEREAVVEMASVGRRHSALGLSALGVGCSAALLLGGRLSPLAESLHQVGTGFYQVTAATIVAVIFSSVLLFLAARGRAVPSAVVMFVSSLPWLVGVGVSRWGASRVVHALAYAEPVSPMNLLAQVMADASLSLTYGALLSGALATAVALGLALAALGTRHGEEPGRSSDLVSAASAALTLAALATGASIARHELYLAIAATQAADPASRLDLASRAVEEVHSISRATLYAGLAGFLVTIALTGWAVWRHSSSFRRVVGGAAVMLVLGAGVTLQRLPPSSVGSLASPAWGATAGGPPLSTAAGAITREGPSIWLTKEGLQVLDTLPPTMTPEAMRAGLESLRREGAPEGCDRMPSDAVRLGLDAQIPAPVLRSFVDAAIEAELTSVTLVARRAVDAEAEARLGAVDALDPLLGLFVRSPYTQVQVRLVVPSVRECWLAQRDSFGFLVKTTSGPLDFSADDSASGDRSRASPDRGDIVGLLVSESATSVALFELAAQLHDAGLQPAVRNSHGPLDVEVVDHPNQAERLNPALSRQVIRQVIHEHVNEVRSCYEQGLARNPHLQGRVVIRFRIATSGHVDASTIGAGTTLNDSAVEDCIVRATRGWIFPAPGDRDTVVVQYPFMLRPDGG